ncbi:MAG: hypothetical protein AAGC55_34630, partial [Myxococcota bacterium]
LLEATAAGCAVVASPLGGTSDVLEWIADQADGAHCAAIDVADPVTSLSGVLGEQLSDWDRAAGHQLAGAVAEHHRWAAIAPRLVASPTAAPAALA